ncbi:winged helix-turn-helix domain-containing protein [Methylobacterium sp. M6A4_1b]
MTVKNPAAWIQTRVGVSLDDGSVGRVVKALGFRKLSARPRQDAQRPATRGAEDPATLAAFEKTCPPIPRTA